MFDHNIYLFRKTFQVSQLETYYDNQVVYVIFIMNNFYVPFVKEKYIYPGLQGS